MQQTFLSFIAYDFRLRGVEKAPGHSTFLFSDKQFGFPQARGDTKSGIVFETAICADCFIGSIERTQHFRRPEFGRSTLRIVALRNLAIQWQRLIVPIQSCKCLSSEKFAPR